MKLKENMKLSKKQKIIGYITIGVIAIGGFLGYTSIKSNIENQKMMDSRVDLYTVVGKEKIFMNGKITPNKLQKLFVGADQGELNNIKVSNSQYVEKGTALFTCKNKSQINEISTLNTQISEKKKEKQKALNEESKQSIDMEIKELNKQLGVLNKTAYQTVYAPFSGNVYLNNQESRGDASKEVMTIQTNSFYVKAQANERDSYKIAEGKSVEITTLATKAKYNGKITHIGDIPVEGDDLSQGFGNDTGMTQYGVDVSLDNQENLKSGLHVQLVALYGSEDKKIPNEAILKEGNKSYVYKVSNNIASKIEVKVSQVKDGFNLVSRGVVEGDQIIEDLKGKDIKDGQEVFAGQ